MRTTKELLIVVRDNLESTISRNIGVGGICTAINYLCRDDILTQEERNALFDYMDKNIPRNARLRRKKYPLEKDTTFILSRHWWTPRSIPPRMKWLNKHIKKQL